MTTTEIILAVIGIILGSSLIGVVLKIRADKKNLAATTQGTELKTKVEWTAYLKNSLGEVLIELEKIRKENAECKNDNLLLRKEVAELKILITRQTLTIEELKDKK